LRIDVRQIISKMKSKNPATPIGILRVISVSLIIYICAASWAYKDHKFQKDDFNPINAGFIALGEILLVISTAYRNEPK
jgi:uncharacterized membrane protein YoaT (DUF817 family)